MKIAKILGTDYKVSFQNYNENPLFGKESIEGYCNDITKEIIVCRRNTYPGYEEESDEYCKKAERQCLRHEIIHAFLSESGLCDSSLQYSGGWAKNEEMVDFFALQIPKIMMVFKELQCEN